MKKRLSEWTLQDVHDYANYRCCDGNWSHEMAMTFIVFLRSEPIFFKKRWFKKHRGELLNLDVNPVVDIETGEIIKDENLQ